MLLISIEYMVKVLYRHMNIRTEAPNEEWNEKREKDN